MKTNAKRCGLGALALAGLYWLLPSQDVAPPPARAEPNYFAFVRSMEGTRPDGALRQDGADRLVVDAELGHLFDYYLAALGEKNLASIKVEIERELERRLPAAPALEAKRLLERYLQYKGALVGVEKNLAPTADLALGARQRLSAMRQLRGQYFSAAETEGLFGAADAYDDAALARIEITTDPALSPTQRKDKLAALDARLTPEQRAARDAPTEVLRLEEAAQQLRAQGAGDNEIYRLRANALSPQAAARLADVDREEADWTRRIGAYQAQRSQLLQAGAGDSALQQLRDAGFTADEQRRLGAYE